jgi:hypothetical protein
MQPAAAQRAGPSVKISVIVLIIGIVIAGFGLVKAIAPIVRTLTSSHAFDTNTNSYQQLDKGKYLIYERTGSTGFGGLGSNDNPATITARDVRVTAPDGETIAVEDYTGGSEKINNSNGSFVGAVTFTVPSSGQYLVRIDTQTPRTVLIAHPLINTVEESLPWWGVVVLGAAVAITGVVLWIVGASRRRRERMLSYANAVVAPTMPPPGWYPDPGQPGRQRYWDGRIWTEHTN